MIKTKSDYKDTPKGSAEYWNDEFKAAEKEFKEFWKKSEQVNDKFLANDAKDDLSTVRLNLFHANITTLRSMLYGRIPKVEVDRRHADQDDDVARVAANIMERMLNTDIEEAGDDYSAVLRNCLDDRLIPGMGCARVRYDSDIETQISQAIMDEEGNELAPEVKTEVIQDEWTDTIYINWKDVMWSPCRTWNELRWRAYRVYLTRDEVETKFGPEKVELLEFKEHTPGREDKEESFTDAWERAELWEIWCKETQKVYWHQIDADEILGFKPDPLKLDGFFPEPQSMFANLTTSKLMPKADYLIAQDLYRSIDVLETRIWHLTRAVKLIGVYDKTADGLQRMLTDGVENTLIPVDNWAMFAEKNGLKGVVDWLPMEDVANVLDKLRTQRDEKINLLYQITGMSDIMRGATVAGETAAAQQIKAKFASVRVQALQDEFARFATDLQKLKAEIISKHFQPDTIIKASNIGMNSVDADKIQAAVALIKQPNHSRWKVMVRSESLAMVDYAQLKQDRTEYINALGLFLQSAAPIVEFAPSSTNVLLELLKWGLAGFKGSNQIEGVIDQAIAELKKNPPEKPDDGKGAEQQAKLAQIQAGMQLQREKHQMEMQGQAQKQQHDKEMMQLEMRKEMLQFRMDMQESQAKLSKEMEKIILQAKADKARAEGQIAVAEAQEENRGSET